MHLLEAALALFEASGDGLFRDLALELLVLFETRLFDAASGTLAEFFAHDWQRLRPSAIEPGHQFEWAWLLHQAGRLVGADVAA
ncbi:AGE family epimerase/isomerase, partial [Salmonella enterica]|uniref:AGE family epimerase/isomerase n=1 Tax=Salmonella enterica TaxID=28901 RepID=UPI003D26F14A